MTLGLVPTACFMALFVWSISLAVAPPKPYLTLDATKSDYLIDVRATACDVTCWRVLKLCCRLGKMSPWRRIYPIYQQFFGVWSRSVVKVKAIVLFATAGVGAMGAGFGFSAGLGMLANFLAVGFYQIFRDGGNWHGNCQFAIR